VIGTRVALFAAGLLVGGAHRARAIAALDGIAGVVGRCAAGHAAREHRVRGAAGAAGAEFGFVAGARGGSALDTIEEDLVAVGRRTGAVINAAGTRRSLASSTTKP